MKTEFFSNVTAWVRNHPWLCALVLFQAAALLLFANTFDNAWTYDDFPVIVDNPDVRSWAGFWRDNLYGRPLRELTYLLDHSLFGLNPAGWHLQQIFWHALNAFLLFALVRRLNQPEGLALFAGVLFLVHPLTVEVVANLSHRKDSLALAFILLALHAYLRALAAPRRGGWLVLAAMLWGVAWLAKENAIVLPGLLLLLEWTLVPQEQRLLTRKPAWLVPAGLAAAGAGVAAFFAAGGPAAYARAGQFVLSKLNVYDDISSGAYLLALLKSWAFMLVRVVWPIDLALEYSYPLPETLADPWILGMLALLCAVPAVFVVMLKRWPVPAFALGFAMLMFLPVANLWPGIYFAADRYLYAPLAGICLLGAWLLWSLAATWRRAALVGGVALLMVLAVLTWRQNDVWQSEFSLWSQAVAVSPDSVYALNNLGVVYGERRDWPKALELITRAAVNPYYRDAQENLARLHAFLGNTEEARRYQERARNPHGEAR